MWLANNKSADQSTHPRSLISAFIIHILLSTIVNEYRFSICPFVDVRSYFLIKVITCWHANNKSADHSAHPRSLISAFIIHILLSTIVNEYRFSICPFVDVRSYFLIKVITCWHANNKSADHSAHPRSLISAFIIRL